MKQILLIFSLILLSSCATIVNSDNVSVKVISDKPLKIKNGVDSFYTVNNNLKLNLKRSKEPLILEVISDSSIRDVRVESKNSFFYTIGNIFTSYGLGMLVDKNKEKRYTYPKYIYLSSNDSTNKYYNYNPFVHKRFGIHFSIPEINSFHYYPEGVGAKSNTGFFGIKLGLEYYYKNDKYVNMSISSVMDFIAPAPAPVDYTGEHEHMYNVSLMLTDNFILNRISLGYGLYVGQNSWYFRDDTYVFTDETGEVPDSVPLPKDPITKTYKVGGFVLQAYYNFGGNFNIGLVYKPSIYRFNVKPYWKYEDIISVDLAWKFSLFRL